MKRPVLVVIGLLLLSACLAACGDPQPHLARAPSEHDLPTLRLATEQLADEYQTVGTVVSDERVEISSRLPAYVRAITVREGEHIRRGQVLVQLDARDQEAAVQQAQAQRAMREAALRDAERTLVDTQTLLKRGLVADAARRKAQLERDTADQALRDQDAALSAARAQLRYTEIVSPVNGVVAERPARAGDLVTPGRPLLVVESDTALLFETAAAESQVQHIAVGDVAQVSIDATGKSYRATVLRVVPSGDPVTRRFTVKLQLDDAASLTPGLFGRSRFKIGETDGLRVPDTALAQRGGLTGVFVVSQNARLDFRWVRTGRHDGALTEITAGLQAGETVLAQVPETVRDGDRLKRQAP
jgi:RND family efflux transporter MFP subunit